MTNHRQTHRHPHQHHAHGDIWMQYFACCFTTQQPHHPGKRRPGVRLDPSMIGLPTNFQHTGHIGCNDLLGSAGGAHAGPGGRGHVMARLHDQLQSKGGYIESPLGVAAPSAYSSSSSSPQPHHQAAVDVVGGGGPPSSTTTAARAPFHFAPVVAGMSQYGGQQQPQQQQSSRMIVGGVGYRSGGSLSMEPPSAGNGGVAYYGRSRI